MNTTTLDKSATLPHMTINGSETPDERDAKELFPHTKLCTGKIQSAARVHGQMLPCTCHAVLRRRTFIEHMKKVRITAYTDVYALIRYQAKLRAERARTAQERLAFEEVASWTDQLEKDALGG